MYKLFMALRYLRAHKIIYFSIAGVAIGIMVLIIVTSVMGGFSRNIRAKIRGMQSDLVVKTVYSDLWISDYELLCEGIRKIPHVTGCAPRIEYIAWMTSTGRQSTRTASPDVRIVGIDPKYEAVTGDIQKYWVKGGMKKFEFDESDPAATPIVIGSARSAWPGIRVRLQTAIQSVEPALRSRDFVVQGSFTSGMAEYDSQLVFVSLESMQRFLRIMPEDDAKYANQLAIAVDDYATNGKATQDAVVAYLHSVHPCKRGDKPHTSPLCGKFQVLTWEEARATLLQAVEVEKGIQSIILFFIVIVAGFNIIAIYTLMVRAKVRDVGILRALGGTSGGVTSIFLFSGAFCGLVGSVLGIALGVLISQYLNEIIDFVRIGSRELNTLAFEGGQWHAGTAVLPVMLFLFSIGALVVSWWTLYRPWKNTALLTAAVAGGLLALGAWTYFGWIPHYQPRDDYDWNIAMHLRVTITLIVGLAPLVWAVLRRLAEPFREVFFGGFFRIVGTILYSALVACAAVPTFVGLGLLGRVPESSFSGYDLFPRDIYYLDRVPVMIDSKAIGMIVVATLVVSLLASIYPALRAAKTDPIEAIRDE